MINVISQLFLFAICTFVLSDQAASEKMHGIAMYGTPALPPDFVSLPYVNPNAPKGGKVVTGNVGTYNSLNAFARKGTSPWQLRYLTHESLMGRSYDESFTVYGLLAESIEMGPNRQWVEFTLRDEARFSDGSKVGVDDVIWSYETLSTSGHGRYAGLLKKIDKIEATGPRTVRLTFNSTERELALVSGLRPILKKAQWDGKDFGEAGSEDIPIGTAPYVVSDYELGRYVILKRNPEYWGKNLNLTRGTDNFDEIRIEFYGDGAVLQEAFKAKAVSYIREFNAETWESHYDFPAARSGEIVKSLIPHSKPSGITGFVMNTRREPLDDWRVRDALLHAFNFEFINDTITGGRQPRINSYFSGSNLGMLEGPAEGRVRELLEPFADELLPGTLEGYKLPVGDGTQRNRQNLRKAMELLNEAGWHVQDGILKNGSNQPFELTVLLRQDNLIGQANIFMNIYAQALERLGIKLTVESIDTSQFTEREAEYDFDLTYIRRALSLSPGNEQRYYWGSEYADIPGSRNLMGMKSPPAEAMINEMLESKTQEEFVAAVRALDRVLTAGRYVIPIHQYSDGRVAHLKELKFPKDSLPVYGDGVWFLPKTWWYEE